MSLPEAPLQAIEFLPDALHAMLAECLVPDRCERVGLLLSAGDRIVAVHPLVNLDRHPGRFLVDGRDVASAIAGAAGSGFSVKGRFHTHPRGPATPSRSDQASLPAGWIDVIVHLRFAEPRAELVGIAAYDRLARRLPLALPGAPDEVPP